MNTEVDLKSGLAAWCRNFSVESARVRVELVGGVVACLFDVNHTHSDHRDQLRLARNMIEQLREWALRFHARYGPGAFTIEATSLGVEVRY